MQKDRRQEERRPLYAADRRLFKYAACAPERRKLKRRVSERRFEHRVLHGDGSDPKPLGTIKAFKD